MRKSLFVLSLLLVLVWSPAWGQGEKSRVIVFGAHPDDCDGSTGGTAILFSQMGHAVKFVAVTNGDAGHQSIGGGVLAKRRRAEAMEAARRFGVEYDVLDNHDGELMPTLEVRKEIIRKIRQWNADIVIGPRPNDYHPDHRYTGVLLQDASFMVIVPNICPDTPALRKNPVFLYTQDRFLKPAPFRPDISVDIDSVFEKKIHAMASHVSQFFEWMPWLDGQSDQIPQDTAAREKWLYEQRERTIVPAVRASLEKWYGAARAAKVHQAEAFEITEYGRQPKDDDIRRLFPMLK